LKQSKRVGRISVSPTAAVIMAAERLKAQGKLEAKLGEKPQTWYVNFAKVIGFTAITIGVVLLILTLTAYFF